MLKKMKALFVVVFSGMLFTLFGPVLYAQATQAPPAFHSLTFVVEEAAWLQVDYEDEIEFVLEIDPEGRFQFQMHRAEVDLQYASIVPENKRRTLTAQLDGSLPEGIAILAKAGIFGGRTGQVGVPTRETALDSIPQVLIDDIGTVDEAQATVTYTVFVDSTANLSAVGEAEATVWFTLTAAK